MSSRRDGFPGHFPESTGWTGIGDLDWEDYIGADPLRAPADVRHEMMHDLGLAPRRVGYRPNPDALRELEEGLGLR